MFNISNKQDTSAPLPDCPQPDAATKFDFRLNNHWSVKRKFNIRIKVTFSARLIGDKGGDWRQRSFFVLHGLFCVYSILKDQGHICSPCCRCRYQNKILTIECEICWFKCHLVLTLNIKVTCCN